MTQNQTTGSICAEEYVVKRGDSFYLIAHKLGVPLRDLLAANRDIHPARLMVGDVLCIPREEDDLPQNGGVTNGSNSGNANGAVNGNTGSSNGSANDSANGTSNGTVNGNTGSSNSNANGSANGTSNGTVNGNTGSSNSSANDSANGTSNGTVNGNMGSSNTSGVPGLSCPIEEQVTLQQGETVADIQLQNLLSRNTLQTANPTVDLDTLTAGQTICVPTENIACTLPSTYTLAAGETLESVAMRFNLPLGSLLRVNPCLAPQDFEEGVTVILPR